MIDKNEDALICDLAETYGIYFYRSLPVRLVATLSAGLRDNSRIKQEMCGVQASQRDILLAHIADRISVANKLLSGSKEPIISLLEALTGQTVEVESQCKKFRSGEEFMQYWNT